MVNQKGFTLLELVFVIIILSIIAGIGSTVIQSGFKSYITHQNITTANTKARLVLERMTRDIHAINSSSSISTATASQLTFTNTSGSTVTYRLNGTQLMRNNQVLADGVTNLLFSYLDSNAAVTTTLSNIRYVTVNARITQNNVSYALKTTINTINYN